MVAFTRRRSLPAVRAAKPREARCLSWPDDSVFSQLRSLPAVMAAEPRETGINAMGCADLFAAPEPCRGAGGRAAGGGAEGVTH